MEDKIIEILRNLMACASVTNTEQEFAAEAWMLDFFKKQTYFRTYPELCGLFPVPDDPLRRNVVWALVNSGETDRTANGENRTAAKENVPTVIFMGHHDVVPVNVYGDAAPWAFNLDEIAAHLKEEALSAESYRDLLSGEWLFGRGCCDMQGGTAVQMALLTEQAEAALCGTKKSDNGALLFLSVPDEESFSAGMRSSLALLESLQEKYGLAYRLAVCAEPNQRSADGKTQVVYSGSIGKLLPVVLVQGKLVQIGSYREGVNPLGILSRIVASTEGDENFAEDCEGERSVPPAWMYVRDLKEGYDFSLPRRAAGYCNVLTFQRTPAQVLTYFLGKIKAAAAEAPQPVTVMTWVTLWQQAQQRVGFDKFLRETEEMKQKLLQEQHKTFPEVTLWLMQRTLDFLNRDQPLVVLGFAPPYYPAVRSEDMKNAARFSVYKKALSALQDVKIEPYFTGVSDCSYCGLPDGGESPMYQANTPLWGIDYRFDMDALVRLQIPFILFGPWGKDLHQIGERVHRHSLTEEYPSVLRKLLRCVWLS